jgi:MYXO-CTERM domain-containing protein
VRDDLAGAIATTITRASRPAFFLCAGFAALALLVAAAWRRRIA